MDQRPLLQECASRGWETQGGSGGMSVIRATSSVGWGLTLVLAWLMFGGTVEGGRTE